MTVPTVTLTEVEDEVGDVTGVQILDPDLCPRYTARYVSGIAVGPSPLWLRQRLEAVGIRSINNVVDVTNYVMFETGQPLHAFDSKLLRGGRIIVRRARAGEELETIDHVARRLDPEMLVIADAERPVALAGVMGGFDSEISEATTEVLIESANFLATNIRKTSRSLGLISESSLRFEKGVDVGGTVHAADRAAQLIAATAGGRVFAGTLDNYPEPKAAPVISLRPDQVNKLLGFDIPAESIVEILKGLQLTVAEGVTPLSVTIPTFRVDLEREVDLIEEVARVHGLNNIPASLLPSTDPNRGLTPLQSLTRELRSIMTAAGFSEVVNYSFIGRAELDRLALPPAHPLAEAELITNPLSEDQALLRTTLITSLLRTVTHNYNRGQKDLAVFEIGNVFGRGSSLPEQHLMLAGAVTGRRQTPAWFNPGGAPADFYDVKGIAELICSQTAVTDSHISPADNVLLRPGQSAELVSEETVVGFIGALHPQVQENYDLNQPVFVFQFSVPGLLAQSRPEAGFHEITRFPAVVLDLALIVDENVGWDRLRRLGLETGAPLLRELKLFDLYRGPGIPAGKKSLAFNLTYEATDRTLTDDEVGHIQDRIVKRAAKELGAELRE